MKVASAEPIVPPPMPSFLDLLMPPNLYTPKTHVSGAPYCKRCDVRPRKIRPDGTYHAYCAPCRKEKNRQYRLARNAKPL